MTNPETIAAYIADMRSIGATLSVSDEGFFIGLEGVEDGMTLLTVSERFSAAFKADPGFNQKVRAALLAEAEPEDPKRLTPADIRAALLPAADPQLASPDARLLILRNALLDEWETELAASSPAHGSAAEDAAARAGAIARRMIEKRAYTLEGLQAKAIAALYCHNGEDIELSEQQTTDVRLAQSILADLLPE